jgi:hypothetical protein
MEVRFRRHFLVLVISDAPLLNPVGNACNLLTYLHVIVQVGDGLASCDAAPVTRMSPELMYRALSIVKHQGKIRVNIGCVRILLQLEGGECDSETRILPRGTESFLCL